MMPNVTRGGSTAGLMSYLFGAGKKNEHTEQHIVAGDAVLMSTLGDAPLTGDLPLDVSLHLDEPMKAYGRTVMVADMRWDPESESNVKVGEKPGHVWHCSLSLKSEEAPLSDETWSQIANDFVTEMGFASDDLDEAGCRWVAVRHGVSSNGNDHIHIAVNLIREDGTKASVHNDFKRAQKIVNGLEHKYGLEVLASRESGQENPRGAKPAELDRQRATGAAVSDRDELRRRLRAAAGASSNEQEFIEQAHSMRVLLRPRFASGGRTNVVGYSAALPPRDGGQAVFFGGAKLDHALSLGALRARWGSEKDETPPAALTAWTTRSREVRSGNFSVAEKATPPRLSEESLRRLDALGQNVVPDRGLSVDRLLSTRLSELYAAASIQYERDESGPFADASREFARHSAPFKHDTARAAETASGTFLAETVYLSRLTQRATGRDSKTGWIAVLRALDRAARAAAERAAATREYNRSEQLLSATAAAAEQTRNIIASQPQTGHTPAPAVRTTHLRRGSGRDETHGRG